jgi:Na+-driven multidrug efflux pump
LTSTTESDDVAAVMEGDPPSYARTVEAAASLQQRSDLVRAIWALAWPVILTFLLDSLVGLVDTLMVGRLGAEAVAAVGVGFRALWFLRGFGLGGAAAALVGQNLGARQPQLAERSGWESNRLAMYLMSACGVIIFVAARPIAALFVDDASVVTDAVSFIRTLAVAQPLMGVDFPIGGALRGAGDTRFPLVAVFRRFLRLPARMRVSGRPAAPQFAMGVVCFDGRLHRPRRSESLALSERPLEAHHRLALV